MRRAGSSLPTLARLAVRPRSIEAAAAALFTLWIAWPYLVPGRPVVSLDGLIYTGPNMRVTLDALGDGRLPLWNDMIFGGVPHAGNPQTAVFSPTKLLVIGLDPTRALNVLTALHLVILAAGTFALCAWRLRLRPPAAFVGCVAAVGCGAIASKAVQFEQLAVVAWAPLLMALLHWLVASDRPWRAAGFGAVATACWLTAGHPQMIYITAPLLAVWAVSVAIDHRRPARIANAAAMAALGALIALPHLLLVARASGGAALGGGRTLEALAREGFSLNGRNLVGALLGDATAGNHAVAAGGFEPTAFLGAGALVLALPGAVSGLVERSRRWTTAALTAAALAALVFALGPRTPVFRTAYRVVPGFDLARVPARWVVTMSICVALLAAMGTHAIVTRARPGRRDAGIAWAAVGLAVVGMTAIAIRHRAELPSSRVVLGWIAVAALTLAAWAFVTTGLAERIGQRSTRAAAIAVACAIVPAALVAAELGLHARTSYARQLARDGDPADVHDDVVEYLERHPGGRTIAATFDEFGDPVYLTTGLRPNANMIFGIRSVDGYDGGVQVTERWADTLRAVLGEFDPELTLRAQLPVPMDPALWARLGVRYVVVEPRGTPASELLPGWNGPVASSSFELWENPLWRGDAVAYFGTAPVADAAEAGAALRADASGALALVESTAEQLRCRAATGGCAEAPAGYESDDPEHIVLTTDFDKQSVVVVAEQWNDGWHATVDGESAAVVPVDGLSIGVELPPGRHVVRLTYRPAGLTLALALAGLASLGALGCVIDPGQLRRRRAGATLSS